MPSAIVSSAGFYCAPTSRGSSRSEDVIRQAQTIAPERKVYAVIRFFYGQCLVKRLRRPQLFRSKCLLNPSLNGLGRFLPALCSHRPYLVIHGCGEFPSADIDALSNVIFNAAIFHLASISNSGRWVCGRLINAMDVTFRVLL